MESLGMCCGPGCPRYSRCRQMYVESYVPFGTAYSRAADFVEAVASENQTSLVPGCHRRAVITQPLPTAAQRYVRLSSGSGAVYFSHRCLPLVNATLWSLTEGGTSDELRLLRGDAQSLMGDVREM